MIRRIINENFSYEEIFKDEYKYLLNDYKKRFNDDEFKLINIYEFTYFIENENSKYFYYIIFFQYRLFIEDEDGYHYNEIEYIVSPTKSTHGYESFSSKIKAEEFIKNYYGNDKRYKLERVFK